MMDMEKMTAYAVYRQAIDLDLYYAFAELVAGTSQEETAWPSYQQSEAGQIWKSEADIENYFESYDLRYPGEVRERFEEKLGAEPRIIRALALALGKTRTIQSDNMFVGNQRGDFIRKVRRAADGDVYLLGALYLLETDTARRRAQMDELTAVEYHRAEEALFILSLFDDREEGYRIMRDQIIRLLGQGSTFSLVENRGVLEWLIRYYAPYVKSYRGKADLTLRTLMKLPYMNMKPDGREFSILKAAGYSSEEITMANSLFVWADRIPDRLSWNGTTAERIAAACCKMLLNRPEGLSEQLYEYAGWLLIRYDKFPIQYEGYPNLWEAVRHGLAPTAPQTILWMQKSIRKDFPYRFDAFDPQYDILAEEVERDDYWELFTEQMLRSCGEPPLRRWLARYQKLTGDDYRNGFQDWHRSSSRTFALLVEKKELRLWPFFERYQADGYASPPLRLIQDYALNVSSWQGFRFVRRLLQKYTPPQLQRFWGDRFYFHRIFIRERRSYGSDYTVSVSRHFLSEEQQRQLWEWIEGSVFQTEPERYREFVLGALQSPDVQRLYDKKLLASVLRGLLSTGVREDYAIRQMKETFYSKEELEAERRAEAEQAEREEEIRREKSRQEKRERLEQVYDGTIASLTEFMRGFYGYSDVKVALDMVYEKLLELPSGCAAGFAPEELELLFKLFGNLARYNPEDGQKILNLAGRMIGGLVA